MHHVDVVHTIWLVDSPRPNVADGQGQRGGQLTGHAQIPLHHIIPLWLGVSVIGGSGGRFPAESLVCDGPEFGVHRKRARREVFSDYRLNEWNRSLKCE